MSDEIFGFLPKKRYLSFSIIAESQLIYLGYYHPYFTLDHCKSYQFEGCHGWIRTSTTLQSQIFHSCTKVVSNKRLLIKPLIKTFQLYIAKSYDIKVFRKNTAKRIKGVILIFLITKPNVTVGKLILQRFQIKSFIFAEAKCHRDQIFLPHICIINEINKLVQPKGQTVLTEFETRVQQSS